MNDVISKSIQNEFRICKCCGNEFTVPLFVEQDFCNKCYPIIIKELFKSENGNLTCNEFIKKMKNITGEINDN